MSFIKNGCFYFKTYHMKFSGRHKSAVNTNLQTRLRQHSSVYTYVTVLCQETAGKEHYKPSFTDVCALQLDLCAYQHGRPSFSS